MTIQLPKYPVNLIEHGAPASTAVLNAPLKEIEEDLVYLRDRFEQMEEQINVDLGNEEPEDLTVDKNLTVGGTISGQVEEAKSYLIAETIYPSNWNPNAIWPTDYTQQADGQWIWNNEPPATAGRHYFYSEIVGRKSIANPAIGTHLGQKTINFRSLKLLDDEKGPGGEPVYEVSGLDSVRFIGSVRIDNNEQGVYMRHDQNVNLSNATLEIIGYFNDFIPLAAAQTSDNPGKTRTFINGVIDATTISVSTNSDSPIVGRFLPSNIPMPYVNSPIITMGVNTLSLKAPQISDEDALYWLSGIVLLVNQTTLQLPRQDVVVRGKKVSIPASTPSYTPTKSSTLDHGYSDWSADTPFNGGRVTHFLDPSDETVKTATTWMPANAKYQEPFSWEAGTQVNATVGQQHPSVIKEGSDFHCWWDKDSDIWYVNTTDPANWGNGQEVLSAGAQGVYDTTSATHPSVYLDGSTYRMIYTGGEGGFKRLIYAESANGTTWTGHALVLDVGVIGESDEAQCADPSLLKVGSTWYLFYGGHDQLKWRIHLATSTTAIPNSVNHWTKHGVILGLGGSGDLDENNIFGKDVIYNNGIFKMLYGGQDSVSNNRILYATSKDGFMWTKHGLHKDLGSGGTFDDFRVDYPTFLSDGINYNMWYCADDGSNQRIGYTSSSIVTGISKKTSPYTNTDPLPSFVPEPHNLGMSHLEEVARTFHWREFGNGDQNGATSHGFDTSSSGPSDRAFILDDGLTGLVGNDVDVGGNQGLQSSTVSSPIILTFIGTGIAIEYEIFRDKCNFKIDGVQVYVQDNNSGINNAIVIASNLHYGLHTLEIVRDESIFGGLFINSFTIFQPKRSPMIPEGSVILGEYMLNADFVQNTTQNILNHSKGIVRNDSSRGIKYDGDSALILSGVDPKIMGGREINGQMTNKQLEISFFGTGVCIRYQARSDGEANANFSLSIDGGETYTICSEANLAANFGNNGSVYSSQTFDADGTFTQVSGGPEYGHHAGVTGLTLDHYVLKINGTTTSHAIKTSAIDIETPIHTVNHYSKTKAFNPFYDELLSNQSGVCNNDLVMGPDGWTVEEIQRGGKNKVEAFCYIWRTMGTVGAGYVNWNNVRGATNGVNVKVKNIAITQVNGEMIILITGRYRVSPVIKAYQTTTQLKLNGITIDHIALNTPGVVTGSIEPLLDLKRGDILSIYNGGGGLYDGFGWSYMKIELLEVA